MIDGRYVHQVCPYQIISPFLLPRWPWFADEKGCLPSLLMVHKPLIPVIFWWTLPSLSKFAGYKPTSTQFFEVVNYQMVGKLLVAPYSSPFHREFPDARRAPSPTHWRDYHPHVFHASPSAAQVPAAHPKQLEPPGLGNLRREKGPTSDVSGKQNYYPQWTWPKWVVPYRLFRLAILCAKIRYR